MLRYHPRQMDQVWTSIPEPTPVHRVPVVPIILPLVLAGLIGITGHAVGIVLESQDKIPAVIR